MLTQTPEERKAIRIEYLRAHYRANRKAIKNRVQKWYQEHQEHCRAAQTRRFRADPQAQRARIQRCQDARNARKAARKKARLQKLVKQQESHVEALRGEGLHATERKPQ